MLAIGDGDHVSDLSTSSPSTGRADDVEHLNDASSEHTMAPAEALDEEIDETAALVSDVLDAVHRLRRLRGLRRAMEEAAVADANGSASAQEVLQQTAVLTDLRSQIGDDVLELNRRISETETDLAALVAAKQGLVDRLRYLHTLRVAVTRDADGE